MGIILEQLIFWSGIAFCLRKIYLREVAKENRQRRTTVRKSITFPNDAA